MASLRSLRMGLSKSYQSLNTLGMDSDRNENFSLCLNPSVNHAESCSNIATDWLEVDNFRKEKNRNRPFHALKSAMSRVSRNRYKPRSSKSVAVLSQLSAEWTIPEDRPINANQILG